MIVYSIYYPPYFVMYKWFVVLPRLVMLHNQTLAQGMPCIFPISIQRHNIVNLTNQSQKWKPEPLLPICFIKKDIENKKQTKK